MVTKCSKNKKDKNQTSLSQYYCYYATDLYFYGTYIQSQTHVRVCKENFAFPGGKKMGKLQ